MSPCRQPALACFGRRSHRRQSTYNGSPRRQRGQSVRLETPVQPAVAFSFAAPATAPPIQPPQHGAAWNPTASTLQDVDSSVDPQAEPSAHDKGDKESSPATVTATSERTEASETFAAPPAEHSAAGGVAQACDGGTPPAEARGTEAPSSPPSGGHGGRARPAAVLALTCLQIPSREEPESPHSPEGGGPHGQLQLCVTPEPGPSCAEEAFPQSVAPLGAACMSPQVPSPPGLAYPKPLVISSPFASY